MVFRWSVSTKHVSKPSRLLPVATHPQNPWRMPALHCVTLQTKPQTIPIQLTHPPQTRHSLSNPRVHSTDPPPAHDPLLKPDPPIANPNLSPRRGMEPMLLTPWPLALRDLGRPVQRADVRRHDDVVAFTRAQLEVLVVAEEEDVGAPVCVQFCWLSILLLLRGW